MVSLLNLEIIQYHVQNPRMTSLKLPENPLVLLQDERAYY